MHSHFHSSTKRNSQFHFNLIKKRDLEIEPITVESEEEHDEVNQHLRAQTQMPGSFFKILETSYLKTLPQPHGCKGAHKEA